MTVNEIFSTIRDWAVSKFQPRGDYASVEDLSAFNLKTYTTLAQLGFTEPATTAEIYAAMPACSQVLLIDTDITDAPSDNDGVTVLVIKHGNDRGFILATGKTTGLYVMHLNSTEGANGTWETIQTL